MKRAILLLSAFSMAGLLIGAPRHSGRNNASGVEQQLMRLEQDWANATLKGDSQALDRLEAEDYVYNIDSMRGTKKDDLADAKSGNFTADSMEETDMTVHVYGDAAVVTGKASLRNAKYKAKDISGDYLFTDTWVRKGDRWQVVASHDSKVQTM